MQDAAAAEGLGVVAGAAELVVVDAAFGRAGLVLPWGDPSSWRGPGGGVLVEGAAEGFGG